MSHASPSPAQTTAQSNTRFLIKVATDIPTLSECYAFVAADSSCGAVATFAGITRNNFDGKRVKELKYEGYVPMAEKELHKLCNEAVTRFGVTRIAAVHVLGPCPVGQASVLLATSSPHRKASLQCVDFLIDELKARIPIWKLEVYDGDDEAVWKENIEWKDGIARRRVMIKQSPEYNL